jgi:Tfp pilus assembly protein PilF
MTGATSPSANRTAFRAFCLAALSCVLGLGFCLIKSPQSRSEAYLAAALDQAGRQNIVQASSLAVEAVRLHPANVKGWTLLAELLQQKGDYEAARQARDIAVRMSRSPGHTDPLYAMPAELKLSLLINSGTGIQ